MVRCREFSLNQGLFEKILKIIWISLPSGAYLKYFFFLGIKP